MDGARLDATVREIRAVYRDAPALAAHGERPLRADELTGGQALGRTHPALPPVPGRVERREFEYRRHGPRACTLNRAVVSGQGIAPSCGPTRTAADSLARIVRAVAAGPAATRRHVIVANLDIHCSESLVRRGAAQPGLTELDLGEQEQRGILKRMASRAACLSDPSHAVVLHDTPKHSSWLDQIEWTYRGKPLQI